jgi:hypothetical protein
MSRSNTRSSLAVRGLSVLRSVGAWVAISPEQTYVATSIRGLGPCKSTYCRAERRDLPTAVRKDTGAKWVPLVAAALAAVGLLASCASYRPLGDQDGVADRDQYGRDIADCQNQAGSVSPASMVQTATGRGGKACRDSTVQAAGFRGVEGHAADRVVSADFEAAGTGAAVSERMYMATR